MPIGNQTGGAPQTRHTAPNYGRMQSRLDYLKRVRPQDRQIGSLQRTLANRPQPQQQTPPPADANTSPTANWQNGDPGFPGQAPQRTPEQQAEYDKQMQTYAQKLFPSLYGGTGEAYQGSELYKYQMGEGEKAVQRLAAARGLTGSSAEFKETRDFVNQLNAQESERARADMQREADRFMSLQESEAARQERAGNEAYDRQLGMLELLMRQSPMEMAYGASGQMSRQQREHAKSMGNYRQQMFERIMGPSGGGGGGIAPQYIAPFPGGPNYDAINSQQHLSGYAGNNSYLSALVEGLGGLFGSVGTKKSKEGGFKKTV